MPALGTLLAWRTDIQQVLNTHVHETAACASFLPFFPFLCGQRNMLFFKKNGGQGSPRERHLWAYGVRLHRKHFPDDPANSLLLMWWPPRAADKLWPFPKSYRYTGEVGQDQQPKPMSKWSLFSVGSENRDRGGIQWNSEPTSPPEPLLKINIFM